MATLEVEEASGVRRVVENLREHKEEARADAGAVSRGRRHNRCRSHKASSAWRSWRIVSTQLFVCLFSSERAQKGQSGKYAAAVRVASKSIDEESTTSAGASRTQGKRSGLKVARQQRPRGLKLYLNDNGETAPIFGNIEMAIIDIL